MTRRARIILASSAFVVVAAAAGGLYYRHVRERQSTARLGAACGSSVECPDALCIHEYDGETYCAKLCESDDDCPTAFVCEPTRSLLRHACMKAGAQTGLASHGAPAYRRVREAP